MAIPDSDPRAAELDAAFAAAASGPARPRAAASAPPEIDPEAPHGRDDDGNPLAPYGWTIPARKGEQPRPKLSAGGRKAKDAIDRPRTATVTQLRPDDGKDDGKSKPAARDWTDELDGLATAAWFGLSAVAKVSSGIPVVGKLLPGDKLTAEAWLLAETQPRLVAAVNLAAQHNARAAAFCAKLEGGDGLWALSCMFMVMPVLSIGATIWKGDAKAIEKAELPTLAEMKTRNDDKMDDMLKKIQLQIATAAGAGAPQEQPAAAG